MADEVGDQKGQTKLTYDSGRRGRLTGRSNLKALCVQQRSENGNEKGCEQENEKVKGNKRETKLDTKREIKRDTKRETNKDRQQLIYFNAKYGFNAWFRAGVGDWPL